MPPVFPETVKLIAEMKALSERAKKYEKDFKEWSAKAPKWTMTGAYAEYKRVVGSCGEKEDPGVATAMQAAQKNFTDKTLDAAATALEKQKKAVFADAAGNPADLAAAKKFGTEADGMMQELWKRM